MLRPSPADLADQAVFGGWGGTERERERGAVEEGLPRALEKVGAAAAS